MMNKRFKFLVSLIITLVLISFSTTSAFAAGSTISVKDMPAPGSYNITLNQQAKDYLKNLTTSGILKDISVDKNGLISLDQSDEYLKTKYNVDNSFMNTLRLSIKDLNTKKLNPVNFVNGSKSKNSSISPNVFVSNWIVYFTQSDVQAYLISAAIAGPAAMALALDGVATLIGGPVGTVLSLVLDIVGAASLVNLCYLVIQSTYYNEGVFIGIQWNGAFPNYTQGVW